MKKIALLSLAMMAGVIVTVGLASATMAADHHPVMRDITDVPSEIDVTVSETQAVDLRLPACISCGMIWMVQGPNGDLIKSTSEKFPAQMVEVVNHLAMLPSPAGGSETQILHFPKTAVGIHQYQIQYGRPPAENSSKPTVLLQVTVKKSGE